MLIIKIQNRLGCLHGASVIVSARVFCIFPVYNVLGWNRLCRVRGRVVDAVRPNFCRRRPTARTPDSKSGYRGSNPCVGANQGSGL